MVKKQEGWRNDQCFYCIGLRFQSKYIWIIQGSVNNTITSKRSKRILKWRLTSNLKWLIFQSLKTFMLTVLRNLLEWIHRKNSIFVHWQNLPNVFAILNLSCFMAETRPEMYAHVHSPFPAVDELQGNVSHGCPKPNEISFVFLVWIQNSAKKQTNSICNEMNYLHKLFVTA